MLLSLTRISRAAAEVFRDGLERGFHGRLEVLLPTFAHRAGLSIEEDRRTGAAHASRTDRPTLRPADMAFDRADRTRSGDAPTTRCQCTVGRSRVIEFRRKRARSRPRVSCMSHRSDGERPSFFPRRSGASGTRVQTVCFCNTMTRISLYLTEFAVVRDTGHKWQLALRHLSTRRSCRVRLHLLLGRRHRRERFRPGAIRSDHADESSGRGSNRLSSRAIRSHMGLPPEDRVRRH